MEKLKYTYRFGESPNMLQESTAAHSWRLVLMTYTLANELNLDIDILKAIKTAIIHDIPECIDGDTDYLLVASGAVSKEKKHLQEKAAMSKIINGLPKIYSDEILGLWIDYENGSTKEARYIKALDKIECLDRVLIGDLHKFNQNEIHLLAIYADKAVMKFPELIPVLKMIKIRLKHEFEEFNIEWKEEYNYGIV